MMNLVKPDIQKLLAKIDHYQSNVPKEIQPFFSAKLWQARFLRETGRDLRDLSLRRDRQFSHDAVFESVRPLGLIGHIMPGNSDWTPLLAILETSITGNTSWVKLPSGTSTDVLKQQLKELGLEESVAVYTERNEIEELYKMSDAISAWGGEGSLDEIKNKISAQVRFIPWGHRISFAYMTDWSQRADSFAAAMVKYEQQACSSPQMVYLENASFEQLKAFGSDLAISLQKHSSTFPELDDSIWAELSNFSETHYAESFVSNKKIIEAEDKSYRIVMSDDSTFEASVLNRTILIKSIDRSNIKKVLAPHRRLLQSAGISCSIKEMSDLSECLFDAGVSRVCTIDQMQDAHPLESHDGEFSLSRFVKRVTLTNPNLDINSIASKTKATSEKSKITTKTDFLKQHNENAHLYFKSGGSTSKSMLSPFMLSDYHLQMQVAADGLVAAGLKPSTDRCMNLFFGGGLYGGFTSFTDILEKIGAIQYPMAGYMELDFVLDTIIEQNVNVLLGMPSYILGLYKKAEKDNIKLPITKIFFGGEPFSHDQRQWLETLGVSLIRSASYGSVDAGPLGYQCTYSDAGVHHINSSIQKIEIVKMNEDKPANNDETGRILVSSLARSGVTISRYEIGDTAKWIEGDCPCGDPSPRLLLVGRTGDIFKFGGSFINVQNLVKKLGHKNVQFEIIQENLQDCLIINSPENDEMTLSKILEISDLDEVVNIEKSAMIKTQNAEFKKASSGKQPLLIDSRHA